MTNNTGIPTRDSSNDPELFDLLNLSFSKNDHKFQIDGSVYNAAEHTWGSVPPPAADHGPTGKKP
jgi:hypothetical protein